MDEKKYSPMPRDAKGPLLSVKALDPKGNERTLRYEQNVCSPHLVVEWDFRDPQAPKVKSIKLADESAAEGWVLVG